jgi:hypothetical protein
MLQARHRTGSTVARRATFVTIAAVSPPPPPPPPAAGELETNASLASDSVSVCVSSADSTAAAGDSRMSGGVSPSVSTILIRKQRLGAAGAASASSFFAFSSRRSRSTGRLVVLRRPRRQRAANPSLQSAASTSPASTGPSTTAVSAHASIEMLPLDASQRRRQSKLARIPSALVQPVLFSLRALPLPPPPPPLPSMSRPASSPLVLLDFPVSSHRRSTLSGPAPSPPPMKRLASLWI